MEKHKLISRSEDLEENEVEYYKSLEKKLNFYEESIFYSKTVSMVSLSAFLILLTLNICLTEKFSWLYLMIPGLLTIIVWTLIANIYLRIEDLVDSLEKKDVNLGTLISYFCVNMVSLSLIVYLILFCLKMNNAISAHFSLISIPLYVLLGIGSFYFIFIVPALLQQGHHLEMVTVGSYIINLFLFLILMNYRLDTPNAKMTFSTIFLPIWIAIILHLIYKLYAVMVKEEPFTKHLYFFVFFAFLLSTTMCICMYSDYQKQISKWLICFLGVTAFLSLSMDLMTNYNSKQEEHEHKKL